MKIILIHGSLQELVSKKVSEIKNNFDLLGISESDGSNISLSSPSLFSEKRLLILNDPDMAVVENVLEKNVLADKDPELTIILRFSKTLEKSSPILKKLTEVKTETFAFIDPHRENIFPLLDMIGNKQSLRSDDLKNNSAFRELEQNYDEFSGQYVLVMMGYFLRRMIAKPKSGGSAFMAQKIEAQKRNFNREKIEQSYKDLIETDFKIKQGLLDEKMGVSMLLQKFLS